ncbi:MAG: right-handed parallel beta-helix repeat-containing protein, partial [Bacteroidetes bacterium]
MGPDPLGTGAYPGDPYASVWRVTGNLTVASGASLRIDAYTVVKFDNWRNLFVDGSLDVYGQPGAEVVFTSINDDAYGHAVSGSTGTPAPGNWAGIDYRSGSSGSMTDARVLYADQGVYVWNASPVLTNLTINQFGYNALHIVAFNAGEVTSPTITNLTATTTDTWNRPLDLYGPSGTVAPVFAGGFVRTADTGNPVVWLEGVGVAPQMSGFTLVGGGSTLAFRFSAGGTFTGMTMDGAAGDGVILGFGGTAGAVRITDSTILNAGGNCVRMNTGSANALTLERNLIRGCVGAGVTIAASQTGPVSLHNNLIVENGGQGIWAMGDPVNLTGPTVDVYSNTVADNGGVGLQVDTYAAANAYDNVLAFNTGGDGLLAGTVTENYNVSTTQGLLAGVGDRYAGVGSVLFDPAAWYLAAGSVAWDRDPNRTAAALPYMPANPYAEPLMVDTGNLDAGYHHGAPAPAVSAALSTVVAASTALTPGATTTITVTPKATNGALI